MNKVALGVLMISFVSCLSDKPTPDPSSSQFYHLYPTEEILSHQREEFRIALEKIRGSIGKRGSGSKTVWSRKNPWGIGLYLSANHVYSVLGWKKRSPEWFDNSKENLGIFETSQIPSPDGSLLPGNLLSADFPFLHLEISPGVTNSLILPEEDFYLGLIDNQKVEAKLFAQYPQTLDIKTSLELFDPHQRTLAERTWAKPSPGEIVIGMGFPADTKNFPKGAVAIGKVLSIAEAEVCLGQLKEAGDSEGEIPYRPEAEFFLDSQGLPGMSGGGVFNFQGQLLGIMVRASNQNKAPKIIRVVKVEYILKKLQQFLSTLGEEEKAYLLLFLEKELENFHEVQGFLPVSPKPVFEK